MKLKQGTEALDFLKGLKDVQSLIELGEHINGQVGF